MNRNSADGIQSPRAFAYSPQVAAKPTKGAKPASQEKAAAALPTFLMHTLTGDQIPRSLENGMQREYRVGMLGVLDWCPGDVLSIVRSSRSGEWSWQSRQEFSLGVIS